MANTPKTQQFGRRRRFGFFFIFRLAPGFFVGFIPQRHMMRHMDFDDDYCNNYGSDEMTIQHINEQEYMFLQRIGVPECMVMM